MKYLKYLWYVIRHKWYVFWECCKLGIPWLGIIHDWSKFLPSEFVPYVNHFSNPSNRTTGETGYHKPMDTGDYAFDLAVFLHYRRNKHHWQSWTQPGSGAQSRFFPIPDKYRREMLADWRGAGKAQDKPDIIAWYAENKDKLGLHPETRQWIENELCILRTCRYSITSIE